VLIYKTGRETDEQEPLCGLLHCEAWRHSKFFSS